MIWPFYYKADTRYWLKVFGWYAVAEATVQLLFFFIFNTFNTGEGSNIEYHILMLLFHCILIWPVWWVARSVRKQSLFIQVTTNLAFALIYGYLWLVPVQDVFAYVYNHILDVTHPGSKHSNPTIDSQLHFSILNYQILKHAFRLSWYYLADYFYSYKKEEQQRIALAVSNKELQLKLLKWHLNPEFYFKTIGYLKKEAAERPENAGQPILQLAKVMEYVIYDARQPQVIMEKEAQFLSNYINLLNQQSVDGCQIQFAYIKAEGRYLVAPLLLAGIVEGISTGANSSAAAMLTVSISFEGSQMLFKISGLHGPPVQQPLLDELYSGRYAATFSKHDGYTLTLQLDAA